MNSTQKEILKDLIAEYGEACAMVEHEIYTGTTKSIEAYTGTRTLKRQQISNLLDSLTEG